MRAIVYSLLLAAVGCGDSSGTSGADAPEREPNDTFETATSFVLDEAGVAYSFAGEIGPADADDNFAFALAEGSGVFVVAIEIADLGEATAALTLTTGLDVIAGDVLGASSVTTLVAEVPTASVLLSIHSDSVEIGRAYTGTVSSE